MSTPASPLFTPAAVGPLSLPNRIVMAPMTRARSSQPGNVPNALMATYYAQRAGAGLIVTEATQISPQGQGYSFTPGIHDDAQIAGWRLVTDAVHAAGGRIVLQLWHVGRMSHPVFHGGALPVAPSAVPFEGKVWIVDPATGVGGMVDCPTPRALDTAEIAAIVDEEVAAVTASLGEKPTMRQMGLVMKAVTPRIAGRGDGKTAAGLVRAALG